MTKRSELTFPDDPLLIEIERVGKWYGMPDERHIGKPLREAALEHLCGTPERYYFVPHLNGRCRISFR